MHRIMTPPFGSQRASTLFVRVEKLSLIFQEEGKFNWSGLLLFESKKEENTEGLKKKSAALLPS